MGFPSPRGVHVAETYASDEHDPYQPPRRNRYSKSVRQTPRFTDVAWISSPEPTPQTPHGPATPWQVPPQAPSSPARPSRPQTPIPPSPAPTVGEHMAVDDILFTEDDLVDPYRPQRQPSGRGILKSVWKGLKKLAGYNAVPPFYLRPGSYESETEEVPAPMLSAGSEASQYVEPTPPETDEQQGGSPYASPRASPYARPARLSGSAVPGSLRASPMPVPSMDMPRSSPRGSPMPVPVPSVHTSPYARPSRISATSPVIPGSRRASPTPVPSIDIAPAITVVSPSIPPSPRPSPRRSPRIVSPGMAHHISVGGLHPNAMPTPQAPIADDGSQTLHEPVGALPPLNTQLPRAPVRPADMGPKYSPASGEPVSPNGSLASSVRRFVAGLDKLPWMADAQIADAYVPGDTPRSQMRRRVRQGADPGWYHPRPEVVDRPAYLSEWDMWAMQSAAALKGGVVYPQGYLGPVYPQPDRRPMPVVP